jgi:DNA-binding CsgD family transcriptional regulator
MLLRCPVLIERDEELRALSSLAGETVEHGARVVVLTGESGTGKSRLAHEFTGSLPEQWSARTIRLTRMGAALPAMPAQRPLVLVLDDAHFLDPSALEALSATLDELVAEPVLLLLTFRLGVHRAGSAEMRALARLVRNPRALELRVMPLSADGVGEMAAAMGRYAGEDLYRRTGGNPFWAEELLREDERIPWTVVEAIGATLDALPEQARELACALAIAEEPLSTHVAAELVGDVDSAWPALLEAGLAEAGSDGIALRHTLVGEAIESRLGPAQSAQWHGRLATVLEAAGEVERDRVARHWAAAGDVERAAELGRAAAPDLLAAGATRRAYACFELALQRPPDAPLAAAELHEQGALTAARVGEYDAMRAWLERAEERYRHAGQPDRAVRMVLDPTFDYLPVRRSDRIREEPVERLLLEARDQLAHGNDVNAARQLIDAAIEAARLRRDGMGLGRAARVLALALGEFERSDSLLSEASEYPDVAVHPGRRSRLLTIRAGSLIAQGYVQRGFELIQRAVAISRREPEAVYRVGEIALANTLLLIGRASEGASALIEAGRSVPGAAAIAQTANGIRRFEGGEPGALESIQAGVDGLLAELDFDPIGLAVVGGHVLGLRAVEEAHGDRPGDALRTVERLDAIVAERYHDVAADSAYVLARAGAALGDAAALTAARRRIGELTRLASGPAVLAAAEAVRGFSASNDGRGNDAVRHFQSAAALFERAPRSILAAESWCDAAAAAGRGAVATTALDRAQRICDELELVRVAGRVAAVRERISSEPAHLPPQLAELTSRERDVVLLAAEGLSNREIGARLYLSAGTVRNYLSTAFGKLGVSRRAELGRIVPIADAPSVT